MSRHPVPSDGPRHGGRRGPAGSPVSARPRRPPPREANRASGQENMPTPTLIKARGGIGAAVWLCFLTLGAGGAWAVVDGHEARRPCTAAGSDADGTMPPATTKQVWAAFSFSDRKRRIYFQCSLDGAPFRDCSSPMRYGPAVYIGRVRCKGQPKTRPTRGKMVSGHRHQPAPGTLGRGAHIQGQGPPGQHVRAPLRPTRGRSWARRPRPRRRRRAPPASSPREQSPEPARELAPRGRRQRAGGSADDLRASRATPKG